MEQEPSTLQEAIVYFSNPANCRTFLMARRWPNGVICPRCGSTNILFLEKYNRWQCREGHASPQFTLKTGTPMEEVDIWELLDEARKVLDDVSNVSYAIG